MRTEPPAVSTRVHELMEELSEAERRVARGLLADYPACGLGTSHSLADAVGVSAATVVRFAVHLGFAGFSDMQQSLRAEVSNGVSSPVLRTLAQGAAHRQATPLGEAMHRRIDALEATLHLTPSSELASAATLIAECPKRVVVTGGFFSGSIARILALQLSQIRSDVVFVEEPLRRDAGLILDAKRRSVFVILDLRRYEPGALELARQAKAAAADIVLITDRWMSPVASVADVVLPVEVEAVPFDTFVALMALVEVIVESVMAHAGNTGLRRMKQWEAQAVGHTRARAPQTQNSSPGRRGPSTTRRPRPRRGTR
ncbi:MAG TPA: MurR/RpiR family transcriptional regulator [Nocardioidaceae bacterium]|nr:MurR/RpiR family transcriptional regulator [Nocardioidaceae bacterium]